MVTLSGENRATVHRRDHRPPRIPARGRKVHNSRDLREEGDLRAIRAMLPKTVRAALYVYSRENDDFMKVRRRVTHVWLHHGDSDKEACFRRKSAAYDVLVVAGQAAIDRYATHGVRIPVGEVQDSWSSPDREHRNSDGLNLHRRQPGRALRTDLVRRRLQEQPLLPSYWHSYRLRPTRAQINSDLPAAPGQPHTAGGSRRDCRNSRAPASGRRGDVTAASLGRGGRRPFAELANAADAMVADVSGVVTDFMQSLKPFAMVATGDNTDTFRARFPSSRSAYVIEWDLSTLDDALDAMVGDDPLAATRVERREYYLGGYENGESARAFVRYLKSLTADPTLIDCAGEAASSRTNCEKRLQPARQ